MDFSNKSMDFEAEVLGLGFLVLYPDSVTFGEFHFWNEDEMPVTSHRAAVIVTWYNESKLVCYKGFCTYGY